MKNNEPIRVAQIMGKMLGGGVEAFVMNYYKHIDRTKIQFDFIIDQDSTYVPKEEIKALGGRIIEIPPYQHTFKYMKELTKIFKENKYKIVHSNLNALSVFPLFCAKIAGVPTRIAHSHSTTNSKEWKKNLIKNILKPFSKLFANEYFCCTEHAGRWLFGDKYFENGRVKIINNAIDVQKFDYDFEKRIEVRKKLNIEDKYVIGHIGRFIPQKNHERIVEIFNEFQKKNKDSVLILIGEGTLKEKIKQKICSLNLEKKVLFLGQREDVNELFQAMDCFLFPSLYEGLGIVLIEAQCSGLNCVASTEVPEVAKVTNNLFFQNLEKTNFDWAMLIEQCKELKNRNSNNKEIINSGYDIVSEAKKLEKIYISLRRENNE